MAKDYSSRINVVFREKPARGTGRASRYLLSWLIVLVSLLLASCARSEPGERVWVVPQSTSSMEAQVENPPAPEVSTLTTPTASPEVAYETPTPTLQQLELSQELAEPSITGVETYPLWGIEMHNMTFDGGLGLIAQAGTDWVRRNALLWSDVEPRQGERNWSAVQGLEAEMGNLANEGIELLLIIRRTPDWPRLFRVSIVG